ncbi:MAG: hemolysin family protein [Acidobacteriota bacterium]
MRFGCILVLLPVTVLIYTAAATLDMCLSALNRIKLRKLAIKDGRKSLDHIVHFLEVHQDVSIALHLSRQILIILVVLVTVYCLVTSGTPYPYIISLASLVGIILIFGQIIPRTFAYRFPDRAIAVLVPIFQRVYFLLLPLVMPLRLLKQMWSREQIERESDEGEELAALIHVAKDEGILEEGEEKLVKSVVEFGDTVVREVMTPRIDMVAIREDAPVAELRRMVIEEKHSRVPVYAGTLDNVTGVILARDLVHMLSVRDADEDIRPLVRQAHFVPETKRVSELLAEFQKLRLSLAVVVNEYGGVAGLVTIEDLLEEIVGEIKDEYDEDRDQFLGDGTRGYEVSGNMELEKVSEFFHVDLSERPGDCNTIAGLVSALAGRMLAEGESVEHQGLRFEVLQGDPKKIQKIRIKKIE